MCKLGETAGSISSRLTLPKLHLAKFRPGIMHQTPFACLVSPGGLAFAIFACPGGWAFANPQNTPGLLPRTGWIEDLLEGGG